MDLAIIVLLLLVWLFHKLYWHYIHIEEEKLSLIAIRLRDLCILTIFIIGAFLGSGIDDNAVFFRY
jgi:hypothetical protein